MVHLECDGPDYPVPYHSLDSYLVIHLCPVASLESGLFETGGLCDSILWDVY